MKRIKFLIVNESLAQAGNERWIYEVCSAIDKEKFDVSVLCGRRYQDTEAPQDFTNYYSRELRRAGISLCPLLDGKTERGKIAQIFFRAKRLARSLMGKPKSPVSPEILALLKAYDAICLIDFYNYAPLKEVIHKEFGRKFFILLHSHKIQFDYDPYVWFEKDLDYRFAYACPKQIEEIGSSGLSLEKNEFVFCPLVLDLSGYPSLFNPIRSDGVTFSVFTRVATNKRIEMFIRAFAGIRKGSNQNCVLNLYGEVQDVDYRRELEALMAELEIDPTSIRFMGHSTDIAESIRQDKINIYWGLAMNASCSYSSIEVGAMGVPCLFWNNDPAGEATKILEETNGAMIVHNDMDRFVKDNLRYAADAVLLAELAERQRKFLIDRHDIANRIGDFEAYVASIAADAGLGSNALEARNS